MGLCGESVDKLPYPPEEKQQTLAANLKKQDADAKACRMLINQEAFFNKIGSGERAKIPYPPEEKQRTLAANVKKQDADARACRMLINQEALFNKICGQTV